MHLCRSTYNGCFWNRPTRFKQERRKHNWTCERAQSPSTSLSTCDPNWWKWKHLLSSPPPLHKGGRRRTPSKQASLAAALFFSMHQSCTRLWSTAHLKSYSFFLLASRYLSNPQSLLKFDKMFKTFWDKLACSCLTDLMWSVHFSLSTAAKAEGENPTEEEMADPSLLEETSPLPPRTKKRSSEMKVASSTVRMWESELRIQETWKQKTLLCTRETFLHCFRHCTLFDPSRGGGETFLISIRNTANVHCCLPPFEV